MLGRPSRYFADAKTASPGLQPPSRRQITNEALSETMVARRNDQREASRISEPTPRRSRPRRFAQLEVAEEGCRRKILVSICVVLDRVEAIHTVQVGRDDCTCIRAIINGKAPDAPAKRASKLPRAPRRPPRLAGVSQPGYLLPLSFLASPLCSRAYNVRRRAQVPAKARSAPCTSELLPAGSMHSLICPGITSSAELRVGTYHRAHDLERTWTSM